MYNLDLEMVEIYIAQLVTHLFMRALQKYSHRHPDMHKVPLKIPKVKP